MRSASPPVPPRTREASRGRKQGSTAPQRDASDPTGIYGPLGSAEGVDRKRWAGVSRFCASVQGVAGTALSGRSAKCDPSDRQGGDQPRQFASSRTLRGEAPRRPAGRSRRTPADPQTYAIAPRCEKQSRFVTRAGVMELIPANASFEIAPVHHRVRTFRAGAGERRSAPVLCNLCASPPGKMGADAGSAGDGNRLIQLFSDPHRGGSRRIRRRVVSRSGAGPRTISPASPARGIPRSRRASRAVELIGEGVFPVPAVDHPDVGPSAEDGSARRAPERMPALRRLWTSDARTEHRRSPGAAP